jgi:hypothetical protein
MKTKGFLHGIKHGAIVAGGLWLALNIMLLSVGALAPKE